MNFIKKIFDGQIDEKVHLQFQKFSKGEFRNRALIRAKKTGKGFTINTSSEFANELVGIVAKKLGDAQTKVTGAIISTSDLKNELDYKKIKQFQGVKKYILDKEMTGREILNLLDKFPKSFFALSFKAGEEEVKIKPKAPKSGKPGKGDEKPKADFCRLKTTDVGIARSFVFEKSDFKSAEIRHTFLIEELIIPKDEKDFAKMRELAKRKGKIIREGEIDKQEIRKEVEFEA